MNSKNHFYGLLLLLGSFCNLSCGTSAHKPIENHIPWGRYINSSYLGQAKRFKLVNLEPYCFELNFNAKRDSVEINYGFEEGKLAVSVHNGRITFKDAFGKNQDMMATLNSDGSISLPRHGREGDKKAEDIFTAAEEYGNEKWLIDAYLDKALLSGEYHLINGLSGDAQATFNAAGKVKGIGAFTDYKICYTGDCLEESAVPVNLVTLSGPGAGSRMYAFKTEASTGRISFFDLSAPGSELKGERKLLKKGFELAPVQR